MLGLVLRDACWLRIVSDLQHGLGKCLVNLGCIEKFFGDPHKVCTGGSGRAGRLGETVVAISFP